MNESLKILIVDDDDVDRMAVRRALKSVGVDTIPSEAIDCAEAIAALRETGFDCVFLDYRLPDQDGLALVKAVRQSGIRIPLIVLTGQGDEEIAVELMKAGASDYLPKSKVSAETLGRILRNATRVYRAEMEVVRANQRLLESNELLIRKNHELEQQRLQIQRQNLKLLEVSRLKSQFLATVSHELRTPMTAIIGFSQLLLRSHKEPLTTRQEDMVKRILNNGTNLLILVNDILDFSKVEAGRLELDPKEFDLHQLVLATAEDLRSLANQKGLKLDVHINLKHSRIINDKARLQQVLANLLSNAIKFTESGGISVEVDERSPEQIKIVVRDTGIGIEPSRQPTIFEPFRQVDQTTTRKHPGTGLGLAIVNSLVEMMQGTINVDSKLGQGSVFQVDIPRYLSNAVVGSRIKTH